MLETLFTNGGISIDDDVGDKPECVDIECLLDEEKSLLSYGTRHTSQSLASVGDAMRSIRFQVLIWYIGPVDVILGRVNMKFRITIFWNSPQVGSEDAPSSRGYGMYDLDTKKVWTMYGRQRAYEKELTTGMAKNGRFVYVPPVSILNAIKLDVISEPEVCLINEKTNLMKWSCLYDASLTLDKVKVASFPHDEHELVLKLGILKHRQARRRWDMNKWRLDLATEEDTKGSIRMPHGLIVDHVKIPGFIHNPNKLVFEFCPLNFGATDTVKDECLKVKLRARREAAYYDRNIMPLLAMLNLAALSTTALDTDEFGARGQMLLAISFVEIGIRLTVDSRLPVVGYEIKLRLVLNLFFYGLIALMFESSFAYHLDAKGYDTKWLDRIAVELELFYLIIVMTYYYRGSRSSI